MHSRVRLVLLVVGAFAFSALGWSSEAPATPAPLMCGLAPLNCADSLKSGQVSCGTSHCDDSPTGSPWATCEYCPKQ